MRFLDRQEPLRRLAALSATEAGGLGLVWGRRRVGKTRLLLEWIRRTGGLYTVGDQSAEQVQRRYFADAVGSVLGGFAEPEYPDWRSLFRALARQAMQVGWRGPLVLDEFPYLVASDPALPSILQSFVDHEAREARLCVVLAGSSQHMMQGLALDHSSPLYGRATEAIELAALPAGFIGEALSGMDASQAVRAWTAWGGIPRYWELAEPFGADLDQAVDHLVLDPAGPLHLEPDRLLVKELPPAVALRPILDAVGGGAHRLSEIAGRIGIAATSLGRPIQRLQELGLVAREQPFGESEKRGKRSLYRIADPFNRMWFRVVAPQRASLAVSEKAARIASWRRHAGHLSAQSWEDLCRASVPRLRIPSVRRPIPWGPARRYWRGDGPEWDVVAAPMEGNALLLGKTKWSDRPVPLEEVERAARELMAKGLPAESWAADRSVVYVVFVPELRQPIPPSRRRTFRVVTAKDVLAALR